MCSWWRSPRRAREWTGGVLARWREESSSRASRLCLNICDHCPLEILHQLVHDLEQNFLHQEVVYLTLF